MKLLILGGTRFVGRHLVTAALAQDHEITLLTWYETNHATAELKAGIDGETETKLLHKWNEKR